MIACESIRFDPLALYEHARQFRRARFLEQMRSIIDQVLSGPDRSSSRRERGDDAR
jgi:hypothetical protein